MQYVCVYSILHNSYSLYKDRQEAPCVDVSILCRLISRSIDMTNCACLNLYDILDRVFFVFFCLISRKIVGDDCFDTFSRKKDATLSVSSESRLTNVRDLRFLYLTGMFICLENMKDEHRQSCRFYFLSFYISRSPH